MLTIAASGLVVASCAGGLQTLDDIPGGFSGPTVIAVSGNSATISFDSGVPTVCNAPFGETTAYGEVATIPMLSGATHDHVLTFSNLKPETTYHYQINATDNAGNLYQSEDFVFTTEASAADQGSANLLSLEAGARVVEVSSNFNGAANDEPWGANNAIDGSDGTSWSSDGDGDEAYLVLELPEQQHIGMLVVHTRVMGDGTARIFSFTVTDDLGQVHGPYDLADGFKSYEFPVDILSKTLRFDAVESSGGNTGFVELAAFGTTSSSD